MNFKKAFQDYIRRGMEESSLYEVTVRVQVDGAAEEYTLAVRLLNGVPILQNIPFRVKIQSKLLKYLRSLARRNDVNKPVI